MAQDQNARQFDSLRADSTVSKTDAQQIYEVLLKTLYRWNAHDIEGYLEVYWKSPKLLVFADSEQLTAGSNSTIPMLTGIRTAIRWGSSNPGVSRSNSLSQT
jgi:hypothetical protein